MLRSDQHSPRFLNVRPDRSPVGSSTISSIVIDRSPRPLFAASSAMVEGVQHQPPLMDRCRNVRSRSGRRIRHRLSAAANRQNALTAHLRDGLRDAPPPPAPTKPLGYSRNSLPQPSKATVRAMRSESTQAPPPEQAPAPSHATAHKCSREPHS